jgi:hypothetical protein
MGDYGEIVSAIARIMWAVDHQDRELFRDSWAEDVDFEVTFFGQAPLRVTGRDELVGRFTGAWTGQAAELRPRPLLLHLCAHRRGCDAGGHG